MKLNDLNILDIGNTIYLTGAIYSDAENDYICMLPTEHSRTTLNELYMDLEDWKKFLRQTDLMETEVLQQDKHGKLSKAILRKSTRQIDQRISWRVFRRDNFTCRYCGDDKSPMTVDHLVLWEDGGPSIEENLVCSCRKCNKTRGNMKYEEWLESPYYRKVSSDLDSDALMLNEAELTPIKLGSIPLRIHKTKR
jgi:5-methylcytosine-specific restriction endonuclease McrA